MYLLWLFRLVIMVSYHTVKINWICIFQLHKAICECLYIAEYYCHRLVIGSLDVQPDLCLLLLSLFELFQQRIHNDIYCILGKLKEKVLCFWNGFLYSVFDLFVLSSPYMIIGQIIILEGAFSLYLVHFNASCQCWENSHWNFSLQAQTWSFEVKRKTSSARLTQPFDLLSVIFFKENLTHNLCQICNLESLGADHRTLLGLN